MKATIIYIKLIINSYNHKAALSVVIKPPYAVYNPAINDPCIFPAILPSFCIIVTIGSMMSNTLVLILAASSETLFLIEFILSLIAFTAEIRSLNTVVTVLIT